MKKVIFSGIFLLVAVAVFFSCKEDFYKKSRNLELKELKEYITKNYPDIEPKASGLYFIEKQKGYGDTIKLGDRVQIFYTTMALDSFVFDETGVYEPYEVIVGSTTNILGLNEGLTYMQPGAKASLIINSELAYESVGSGLIPSFATLLMDVEVYKVFPLQTSN
ncbi:MAG: FKBP-type peptidyl-prolyl cis-trans isomerase [Bacteroidales bacterium]|jgi:FKBP-type peptidyl-prolyl cis-trans isomerase|nr:FKBP-type peptidyl-prolyl cis-trans isomerase [Bacteroidales bacterium]